MSTCQIVNVLSSKYDTHEWVYGTIRELSILFHKNGEDKVADMESVERAHIISPNISPTKMAYFYTLYVIAKTTVMLEYLMIYLNDASDMKHVAQVREKNTRKYTLKDDTKIHPVLIKKFDEAVEAFGKISANNDWFNINKKALQAYFANIMVFINRLKFAASVRNSDIFDARRIIMIDDYKEYISKGFKMVKDKNESFYRFCCRMVNHKKYNDGIMPKDHVYSVVTKVGRHFNMEDMRYTFMLNIDFFVEIVKSEKYKSGQLYAMYVCSSAYAALVFLMYYIFHSNPHTFYVNLDVLHKMVEDSYNNGNHQIDFDAQLANNTIEGFRSSIARIDDPDNSALFTKFAYMAAWIISCFPSMVTNYEDMERANDVMLKHYGRLCRTRRKKHDIPEYIREENQGNIKMTEVIEV